MLADQITQTVTPLTSIPGWVWLALAAVLVLTVVKTLSSVLRTIALAAIAVFLFTSMKMPGVSGDGVTGHLKDARAKVEAFWKGESVQIVKDLVP